MNFVNGLSKFNSAFKVAILASVAMTALSSMHATAAAAAPVADHIIPIEQEPNHHLVLSADALRVFDVTFPAGAQSRWHTHSHDSVMVTLDGADVPSETPGVVPVKRPPIASGYIYYKPYGAEDFTHRITNVDNKSFRILDVELLKPVQGLTLDSLGSSWSVVLENNRVRVSKATIPAGASLPAPFKGEHLFAVTTDASLAVGDMAMNVKRGSVLSDATAHAESIRNTGDAPIEIVAIELK